MTTIYVFGEASFPGLTQLRETLRLTQTVEEYATWETLEQAISQKPRAVVFFAPPAAEIGIWNTRLKQMNKAAATIAVIPEAESHNLSVFQQECDFLRFPFSQFDLLSRTATAIRVTGLQHAYEATSQLDEITPLYNRAYFFKRLNEEISLSKRHLSPLSCVILGINFYQVYSDSYGYAFITEFLKHIAAVVQGEVRQEDIMARVSDEEIGLLLPRSTEKGAKILTHRIIQKLQAQPFAWEGEEEEVSVRAGIAGYPLIDEAAADADSLVRYARHALYQARCASNQTIQLFTEIQPSL